MAKDDMEVIIYKILRYLYDSMKAGRRPAEEDFCCNCRMFTIPRSYWNQIIEEMKQQGLIDNVFITRTKSGSLIDASEARITLKGRDYLRDNNGMKTAGDIAGKAFEIILETMIKALPFM